MMAQSSLSLNSLFNSCSVTVAFWHSISNLAISSKSSQDTSISAIFNSRLIPLDISMIFAFICASLLAIFFALFFLTCVTFSTMRIVVSGMSTSSESAFFVQCLYMFSRSKSLVSFRFMVRLASESRFEVSICQTVGSGGGGGE
ncbi:hypothetical protein FGO68_gene6836 [Halteria grandinella]|uniref:Uncharacterized protein n=1 Tax=Halteria grandinella TaxID=5974 RepID=A0A8J8SWZ5_HALGN|nr:hypothetical protein FGO68_gene6836 [Halteria grandinella]